MMRVAHADAKEASVRAVVLNADGTIKRDLGMISYWHKNPLRRLAWWVRSRMKGK